VDTTVRFDPQGNQVAGNFGRIIAARDPRIMQCALRVTVVRGRAENGRYANRERL
jgi:hypothetical protein